MTTMLERMRVRLALPSDVDAVARQFFALWPEGTLDEHRDDAEAIVAGRAPSTLPLVIFVAEIDGAIVGCVEVGLRSHADGCDGRRPVGFVEGWFVEPTHRNRGVGSALLVAAEDWARDRGCTEMASDTWLDNEPSQRAHEALGYEVVDRCVHYKKTLA